MNRKAIFTEAEMIACIEKESIRLSLTDTPEALAFAIHAHEGQYRKNSHIPYINHPLTMTCQALHMGIQDDALLSACLLHDTVEDCNVSCNELPVSSEAQQLVLLMTHGDKEDTKAMDDYFAALRNNPRAALIKCLDRCSNLSTMSWGLSLERQAFYIVETEQNILPLANMLLHDSTYHYAAWLLKYQMESLLDTLKNRNSL